MKTTAVAIQDSDIEESGDVLLASDEISTSFSKWILNFIDSHHVCFREELFDF